MRAETPETRSVERRSYWKAVVVTLARIARFTAVVVLAYVAVEDNVRGGMTVIVFALITVVGFLPFARTEIQAMFHTCLLYTSPSPRDA